MCTRSFFFQKVLFIKLSTSRHKCGTQFHKSGTQNDTEARENVLVLLALLTCVKHACLINAEEGVDVPWRNVMGAPVIGCDFSWRSL